jgi:hypothetical protein
MDEHEFEALREWQAFSSNDVKMYEALPALALELWGRTAEDLRQRLLAPTPKVPYGCTLRDLQMLEQQATMMRKFAARFGRLGTETIAIGTDTLSVLEARCEVVRRAIDYLEGRR